MNVILHKKVNNSKCEHKEFPNITEALNAYSDGLLAAYQDKDNEITFYVQIEGEGILAAGGNYAFLNQEEIVIHTVLIPL